MSNGGGGGGGCGFHAVISAARAIDPNDVTARLNAAPMQAAANFLESMTLPLCLPLLPDPPARPGAQHTQSVRSARLCADPKQSRSPTSSMLDRRNRPPIASSSLASHVPT